MPKTRTFFQPVFAKGSSCGEIAPMARSTRISDGMDSSECGTKCTRCTQLSISLLMLHTFSPATFAASAG
jgi:hypothetical protein